MAYKMEISTLSSVTVVTICVWQTSRFIYLVETHDTLNYRRGEDGNLNPPESCKITFLHDVAALSSFTVTYV